VILLKNLKIEKKRIKENKKKKTGKKIYLFINERNFMEDKNN